MDVGKYTWIQVPQPAEQGHPCAFLATRRAAAAAADPAEPELGSPSPRHGLETTFP